MFSGSILRRLAALVLLACSARLSAQVFDLDRERESVVSLDGQWRFHTGDSPLTDGSKQPLWASADFDDSGWELLNSNTPWSDQGHPRMSGYAWYRFKVAIPANEKPASLLFAPIETSYAVYVDGRIAGVCGDFPPRTIPSAQFSFHLFPLTSATANTPRTIQVALRVWHSPMWADYVGGGPNRGGHLAGDRKYLTSEQMQVQLARNTMVVDAYSYSITSALVGLAIFCLFLFHPAEREFLWFSVILLAQSADNAFLVAQQIFFWPPAPIYDLLDGLLVAISICATLFFVSKVVYLRQGKIGLAVLALAAFSPFAAVFYWPGWLSAPVSGSIQIICLLPSVMWILVVLVTRAWQGDANARLLLLPAGLDLGFYFADNVAIVIGQAGWISNPRLLEVSLAIPPFNVQIGILLHMIFLLALLVFLIRRFALARRREQQMGSELEAARVVQQVLIPTEMPAVPGFAMASVYRPASQVGGDFFQIIPLPEGAVLVAIGDVSGKGMPAAMTVSLLVGTFRTLAHYTQSPGEILSAMNQRMLARSHGGFTTCLVFRCDADGKLTVANAGHIAPYVAGSELALENGLPLGLAAESAYAESTFQLAPGEQLTLLTDGVVEARDKAGTLFGFERSAALSNQSAEAIASAAQAFGQDDDITVLTLSYDEGVTASI